MKPNDPMTTLTVQLTPAQFTHLSALLETMNTYYWQYPGSSADEDAAEARHAGFDRELAGMLGAFTAARFMASEHAANAVRTLENGQEAGFPLVLP